MTDTTNLPIWKSTHAKISLQQERSIGFFKKKYSFALTYYATIIRDKTTEEIECNNNHQSSLETLEAIFPIIDTPEMFIDTDKIVHQEPLNSITSRRLFVQDVEVSKELFEKYKGAKSLPLEYDSTNPYSIKIY